MADHSTRSDASREEENAEPERSVVSSKIWSINLPPPSSSMKSMIPRVLVKTKRRKFSLEVHRVKLPNKAPDEPSEYEECVVRVWVPQARSKSKRLSREGGNSKQLSVATLNAEDDDDDDETDVPVELLISTVPLAELSATHRVKYQLPLRALTVKKASHNSVTLHLEQRVGKQKRQAIFDTPEQASEFVNAIKTEKDKEGTRLDIKMKTTLSGIRLKPGGEKLDLLVEIVSGWNLPVMDLTSSDPFVICSINGREVHRTKYISKSLDPVWTLQTGSLFIFSIDSKELFAGDGLFCRVVDYDVISSDDMGFFVVPPDVLYKGNGEREVFKLKPPAASRSAEVPGHLAIRCRRATQYDIDFLAEFKSSQTENTKSSVTTTMLASHAAKGGKSNLQSILSKNVKHDKHGGPKKYKIRPGPDPKRKLETEWMTAEQIEYECAKESQHWIDSGSGKIGKIYVEVLGCDGLPNYDTGGFLGNMTDAFCSIVFEDTVVQTDIIDDSLNPRWLPWTKRAFVFHISHSSSQLFVGVFDNDLGMDDHDLIGKVSVDLTNLKRNTIYTMKYDIFKTAQMSSRKAKGSVTLRLRLEIDDERKLLLACLEPPPEMYVNVKTRKDFRCVRWTTLGKFDMEQYNMKVMNSYIEELLAYQQVLYYVEDAILSLLLWRSHFEFTYPRNVSLPLHSLIVSICLAYMVKNPQLLPFSWFFCFSVASVLVLVMDVQRTEPKISLPLHSIVAFICFTRLVENPELLPSFFCFSVSWFLFAVMAYRRKETNPWSRCKSFTDIFNMLVFGKSFAPPDSIACNENYEATKAVVEEWQKRLEESEERAKKNHEEAVKAQQEYEKDMAEIGEAKTDISTKSGGMNVDIFKPIFFPIQKNLAIVCRMLRTFRAIVVWDECYFAFWIATSSVVMGCFFMFVPWFWILKWAARFIVWTVFGPWMKAVDVFYYSKIQPLSEDEIEQQEKLQRLQRQELTSKAATQNRIKRENAAKLSAVKKFMFGNYIARVPILKADRYRDIPRPESMAVPYKPRPLPLAELAMREAGYRRTRLPGQHLKGDMIPRVESVAFTDAPLGQATANPELLSRESPGGSAPTSSESTAVIYAKLGSVVAGGLAIALYGAPLLNKAAEEFLRWI